MQRFNMALVRRLESTTKDRPTVHGDVVCLYSVFSDPSGNGYLQLDTYGSDDRDFPGKISQSVQFNRDSAAQLKKLIEQVFPNL